MPAQARLMKHQALTQFDRKYGCILDANEYGTLGHSGALGRYKIPFQPDDFILCAGHAEAFNAHRA